MRLTLYETKLPVTHSLNIVVTKNFNVNTDVFQFAICTYTVY